MSITGTSGPDVIEIDTAFTAEPTTETVDALEGDDRIIFHWIRDAPEGDDPPRDEPVSYDVDGGPGADTLVFHVEDDPEFNIDTELDARTGTLQSVSFVGIERVELFAANGNDTLYGIDGNDLLDGGGHSDEMHGGLGSDTYIVNVSTDQVIEASGAGTDLVRSSASFVLGGNVENLTLTGGSGIDGTGNGLNNILVGNGAGNELRGRAGHDRLDGRGGPDSLEGGEGHDVYVVDNGGDEVIEAGSAGNDTVESSVDYSLPTHVERLVLTGTAGRDGRGNSADNVITGNGGGNLLNGGGGDDRVDGGAGNDLIYGSAGMDSLRGGAGLDRFLFNTAPGDANVDRILDFSVADDVINLANYIFTEAGPNGTLCASAFHIGASAADAGDRIVFDTSTQRIYYDPDGLGGTAQLLFATVTPGTDLTNADFVIYG